VYLSLLLIPLCFGHGWLVIPQPRGFTADNQGSASQNQPCGLTTPDYVAPYQAFINGTVPVTWSLGGGHTGIKCRVALAISDQSQAAFDSNVLLNNITCDTAGQDFTTNVSLPAGIQAGLYYLQWMWFVDPGFPNNNWYSCTKISVFDPNILITEMAPGGITQVTINASSYTGPLFYSVYVPTYITMDQFLRIKVNTSTDVVYSANVTGSADAVPTSYNDGTYVTTDSTTLQFINLCKLQNNIAYTSVFAQPGFSGDIYITNTLYNSHLDWVGVQQQDVSFEANTLAFFWTAASTTLDVPKRIIAAGRGGNVYVSGPLKSCTSTYTQPYSPTPCADVNPPQANGNNANQYFAVKVDAAWTGKVYIDGGTCATYSSATSLFVSLIFFITITLLF